MQGQKADFSPGPFPAPIRLPGRRILPQKMRKEGFSPEDSKGMPLGGRSFPPKTHRRIMQNKRKKGLSPFWQARITYQWKPGWEQARQEI